MIQNLVSSSRLSRARSISDKNVLEFAIIQEIPLITYCIIQGSAQNPYTAIINLQEKYVAHYCPDFLNRSFDWCKHLGKLLLMLSDEQVKNISNQKSQLKLIKTSNLSSYLEKIKEISLVQVGDKINKIEIPFNERIKILCRYLLKKESYTTQVKTLVKSLEDDLNILSSDLILYKIDSYFELLKDSKEEEKLFIEAMFDFFYQKFHDILEIFIQNFWNLGMINKLENAYILNKIANKLNYIFHFESFKKPKNISNEEICDAKITLELLFNGNQENLTNLNKSWNISPQLLKKRYYLIYDKLEISGTSIIYIKKWISSKTNTKAYFLPAYDMADDFLIYIMKSAGERPIYFVKEGYSSYYNQRDFSFISTTLLERYPTLNYVIQHIKTSNREYIMNEEINLHRKFFNWLKGDEIIPNWIEHQRKRQPNFGLSKNSIIIQWDVNVNKLHEEFLQSFTDGARIIIDPTSPIISFIQPFDYTLCNPKLIDKPNWTKKAQPKTILTPDQVVFLIKKGVPIISNVLPWQIISDFTKYGYISSGEIDIAIKKCDSMKFIYGSYVLKSNLEKLAIMGKMGLSEKMYSDYQIKLGKSTKRLNVSTRDYCRNIYEAEKRTIEGLFKKFSSNEKDILSLILKSVLNSKNIAEFRIDLIQKIFKSLFEKNQVDQDFFKIIGREDLGPYQNASKLLFIFLKDSFLKFSKKFFSRKKITGDLIWKDKFGRIIASNIQTPQSNILSDIEREKIEEKIQEISWYFQ
ncbi:hypothetical protein DSAG12_03206 [Promethearchaeum syntrophicum]|uniref:Uncharacterized protein n=1 Tax=Promethearchaeum syntrophicum TaxID=2594042 RepID=A0A5B9DF08_9ARCH|nr:hypothetical protein [Candidatus Prometheoarchaeum syntrophicum]QEE17373.1 hypothetical protein DSAG12_03206 [Candidatus Prometheoarchaeum syntrophicum]